MVINKNSRGRPVKLTKEMEKYLTLLLDKYSDKNAAELRESVISKFREKIEFDVSSEFPEKAANSDKFFQGEVERRLPGLSSIQKFISKHKHYVAKPEDGPWTIGACKKYFISPDVVPLLIKIQKNLISAHLPEESMTVGRITIRDAQWISKISPLFNELSEDQFPKSRNRWILVLKIAKIYSAAERISLRLDEDVPDTRWLDRLFFEYRDFSNAALSAGDWDYLYGPMFENSNLEDIKNIAKDVPGYIVEMVESAEKALDNSSNQDLKNYLKQLLSISSGVERLVFMHDHQKETETIKQLTEENNNEQR